MRIGDYELIDHGIENSQYFEGCGTAFTSFNHVATGIGSNFAKAYEDCCEMISQTHDIDDWDRFDKRVLKDIGRRSLPKRPAITSKHGEDCYYHISIRYNLEDTAVTEAAQHAAYDAEFGENDSNATA